MKSAKYRIDNAKLGPGIAINTETRLVSCQMCHSNTNKV
jgi:hypothetical protein